MGFLGYIRQVVQWMESLESKYTSNQPAKQQFCISTQHYAFTTNALVELVQCFGQGHFELILNKTQTHQIITDVKNRFSDIEILYFNNGSKGVLRENLEGNDLVLYEFFATSPHVFLCKDHPLVSQNSLKLRDLQLCPKLSFVQGNYKSAYFVEELLSNEPMRKNIKVSDRAATVSFVVGLNGYTISSRIFPRCLQGNDIASTPLDEDKMMRIGYILNKDAESTGLGETYIDALKEYRPQ